MKKVSQSVKQIQITSHGKTSSCRIIPEIQLCTSGSVLRLRTEPNKPFFEKYHTIFMEYFLNFNSAPQKNHQFLRIA